MVQISFNNQEVNVCEHISELKNVGSDCKYLFGRFYNKKQLLNAYLNKYTFTEDGETTEEDPEDAEGNCGQPCGGATVIGSRVGDYWVLVYKLEDIGRDESEMEEVLYKLKWNSATFLKADDGQIYFIEWNVD